MSAILGLTLLLCASGLEVRGAAGVQLDAAPHGILDLGLRSGPWSAELYTDTLDLRFAPAHDSGRSFVALRLGALAAQLLFAPWSNGAPDPGRALLSPHAALQLGWYEYLGRGLYLGLEAEARAFLFFPCPYRAAPAPAPSWFLCPMGVVASWTAALDLRLEAITDVLLDRVAPRGAGYFRLLPEGRVVPRIEIWAGSGQKQGDLLRTRLGGLNPYVVPLAGAGWAERWVEDYAVLRIGPHLHFYPLGLQAQLSLVADLAWADDQQDLGLGILGRLDGDPWFVELSGGYTPTLPRPAGASRLSAFLMAGARWAGW